MSDKLKAADAMAKAVREFISQTAPCAIPLEPLSKALAAYEAAPAETVEAEPSPKYAHQPCDDCDLSFIDCWTARSPCVKKPLPRERYTWKCKTCSRQGTRLQAVGCYGGKCDIEHAPRDQSQQLAAAQARIAELESSHAEMFAGIGRLQRDELRQRVAVLEKALEGAEQRWKKVQDLCVRQKVMLMDTGTEFQIWKHGEITAQPALAPHQK